MAEHLVNVPHRHVIFTISDVLRPLFLEDRNLLKFLFEAASETFSEVINRNWKGHLNVGMVVVCHTFSRSSEWNPHVHCICTEGGFTDWGVWYHRPFIKYEDLRLTFMEHLLVKLRKNVKDPASFAAIEAEIRGAQKKGFFVYAPPPPQKFAGDLKQLVKYTARYLGRPCIATSRIDSYDGQVVKFHYWAHTENGEQLKHEVLTGLEFVQRLAQHIQEPNFKKVRFYGIYASHGKGVDALHLALERPALNHQNPIAFLYPPEKHAMRQSFCHFRGAMFHAFGVDPLVCPECHVEMTLDFCVYKGHIFMHPPTLRHAPCPPPQMTG